MGTSHLELRDLLLLLAQSVDAETHHVAGFQKFRLRLEAQADAGRRAGDDDVARLQHEELRAVPDEVRNAEYHGAGRALDAMAKSGLVWVVALMRSDFFDRLETMPALASLSADESRYLLLPPDQAEVGQIIRRPSREAGLSFEVDAARAVGLDDIIYQAAAAEKGALPLLSFLLDQLWQRRSEDGLLTFAA
jgi:hypothetical protein